MEIIVEQVGFDLLVGVCGVVLLLLFGLEYEVFYIVYLDCFGVLFGLFIVQVYDVVFFIVFVVVRVGKFDCVVVFNQLQVIGSVLGYVVFLGQVLELFLIGDIGFIGSFGFVNWDAKGDLSDMIYEIYEFQLDGIIILLMFILF